MTEDITVVVGDPHAHPRYDNDRFELIGYACRKMGAKRVHCVGDWTDWPSLSAHKTKREMRKALYNNDCEAGNDALERFDAGLDGHKLRKTITLGNHDMYPDRYVSENEPLLEGKISWSDVRFEDHGWKTTPFKQETLVKGFVCSHYFPSGITGRAQGGVHVAHQNVTKQGDSVIFGHGHVFDMKVRTYGGRRKVWGFGAGCMTHPRYDEPWCKNTRHMWDRGLLFLYHRGTKLVGHRWVDQRELKRL